MCRWLTAYHQNMAFIAGEVKRQGNSGYFLETKNVRIPERLGLARAVDDQLDLPTVLDESVIQR